MNGILIIDKPQWYTSFDVVAKIRKTLGIKKVGHTGTLDPMTTGVLVVCVGEATKLVDVLTCEDKIYKTTIKLGIKTDTGDMAGNIEGVSYACGDDNLASQVDACRGDHWSPEKQHLSDLSKQKFTSNLEYVDSLHKKLNLSNEQIEKVISSFIGKQKQTPPMYSSIKVDGKKLYEYARRGERVELPKRDIEIFNISNIEYNGKDEISYTVHCSKGTYIRTLNEDIAKKLGTFGTTKVLRRIKTGQFKIDDSVDIDSISNEKIIPIEKLFENKIVLNSKDEKKLVNGMDIKVTNEDGIYNVYLEDKYVGICKVKDNNLKRYILV